MIRRSVLLALMLVSALWVSLVLPASVGAADPPASLRADAKPDGSGGWTLSATLIRAGAPQSQASVTFFQRVDFFGERWVPLGTAVTDAAGVASFHYSPTSNGDQLIVARHRGEGGSVVSDPVQISVSGAIPFHPAEEPILPVVRAWALPVSLLVLVAVWLAIAGILLRAVIGVSRSSPHERQPRGRAAAPRRAAPVEVEAEEPPRRLDKTIME